MSRAAAANEGFVPPEVIELGRQTPVPRARRIAAGIVVVLTCAVAVASYRYLFNADFAPPLIADNAYRTPWLVVHAGVSATALLVAAAQFSGRLRERRPSIHRALGRIYVISCLFGGAAGLVLAIGSKGGAVASTGFGLLAVAWLVVNVLGWHFARRRRFAAHRRWMVRSWALTLSAVTLRVYLPVVEIADLPFLPAYQAISFLAWVPNLIVAEWLLRRRETPHALTIRHLRDVS